MRLALLTTQTFHHTYFLREVSKAFSIEIVLVETSAVKPTFEIHHPFEEERDAYESRLWFDGEDPPLSSFAETKEFESINDQRAVSLLRQIAPDVVVVFGTGRLFREIISVCPGGMINLHGGDPEEYRGLDSHLWAIYHNHFEALVTTLHMVNEKFDDGEVIVQASIDIYAGMPLYELRRYNTEVCVKLTLAALDMHTRFGTFIVRKQRKIGRYYSFMPSELKQFCKTEFEKYSSAI